MELLQWSLSADDNDTKNILIRLNDEEMFDVIAHNLVNAGLEQIEIRSHMCVTGCIKAAFLKDIALCPGVVSVSELH